jgi:hypothetical protein
MVAVWREAGMSRSLQQVAHAPHVIRIPAVIVCLVLVTSLRVYDTVPAEVSAMLNWLLRLWHRIDDWMHRTPHRPF